MRHKRYTNQIFMQILEACRGEGASKTMVVYASGLNFKTIIPYLVLLNQNQLINVTDGPTVIYRLTPKGYEALNHLRELNVLIPERLHENDFMSIHAK